MSQLNISTLANLAGSESTPIADVVNGSARAWVNFNGTGTVAIRASYNVSSITDNGTGIYTVNFTNSLPDANYSAVGTAGIEGDANNYRVVSPRGTHTENAFKFNVSITTGPVDVSRINVTIFR